MKTKFLSFLFFCGACIFAFGQELQSPQINQNAIFANPGLAGSKGQTRIGTSLNLATNNYRSGWGTSNNALIYENYTYNKFYNGLVSIDGLLLKNKLGIGGYLKTEHYQRTFDNWSYNGSSSGPNKSITDKFSYSNLYFGIMLAPKFYIQSSKLDKKGKAISPAISVGFKGTQFSYSGVGYYFFSTQDSLKDNAKSKSLSLEYLSLGLLYSTSKAYIGLKVNFNNYQSSLYLYDISVVIARSYFNKKIENPKFSFNPQLYLSIPSYYYRNNVIGSHFYSLNKNNLGSTVCLNLDFRYKKILFGTFAYATENNGGYLGITGGIQLSNAKIVVNYSPKLSPKTNTTNGLFLSANFYLKAKKERYR